MALGAGASDGNASNATTSAIWQLYHLPSPEIGSPCIRAHSHITFVNQPFRIGLRFASFTHTFR